MGDVARGGGAADAGTHASTLTCDFDTAQTKAFVFSFK